MTEDNRYRAPQASLIEIEAAGDYGSIEKALAGDYELSIGNLLSEAWAATNGNKMVLNMAMLSYVAVMIVYFVISAGLELVTGATDEQPGLGATLLTLPVDLVFYGVTSALSAGLYVLAARLSMERSGSAGEIFRYLNKTLKALGTYVLMIIMIVIGFILLVLPGIYLSIAYIMAIPLALEKDLSPWQALETSRKALSKKWFAVFGLMIVVGVLGLVGLLTLGIGFIWLAPMIALAYGILYRDIFGLEAETLSS